jgi:hypothetical protein
MVSGSAETEQPRRKPCAVTSHEIANVLFVKGADGHPFAPL